MIAELKIRYDALEAKRQIVFDTSLSLSADQTPSGSARAAGRFS